MRAPLPRAEQRLLDENRCLVCRKPAHQFAYCLEHWRIVHDQEEPAWTARPERRRPARGKEGPA